MSVRLGDFDSTFSSLAALGIFQSTELQQGRDLSSEKPAPPLRDLDSLLQEYEKLITSASRLEIDLSFLGLHHITKGDSKAESTHQHALEKEWAKIVQTIERIEDSLPSLPDDEKKENSKQIDLLKEQKAAIEETLLAPISSKIQTTKAVIDKINLEIKYTASLYESLHNDELALQARIQNEIESNPESICGLFSALDEIRSKKKRIDDSFDQKEVLIHEIQTLLIKLEIFELQCKQKRSNDPAFQDAINDKERIIILKSELFKLICLKKESDNLMIKNEIEKKEKELFQAVILSELNTGSEFSATNLPAFMSDPQNVNSLCHLLLSEKRYTTLKRLLEVYQENIMPDISEHLEAETLPSSLLISHILELLKTNDRQALNSAFDILRFSLCKIPDSDWSKCFIDLYNNPFYSNYQKLAQFTLFIDSLTERSAFGSQTNNIVNHIIFYLLESMIEYENFDQVKSILSFFSERINRFLDLKSKIIDLIVLRGKPLHDFIFPHGFFNDLLVPDPELLFNKINCELALLIKSKDCRLFLTIINNKDVKQALSSDNIKVFFYLISKNEDKDFLVSFLDFLAENEHLFDPAVQDYVYNLCQNKEFVYENLSDWLKNCTNENLKNFLCVTAKPSDEAYQQTKLTPPIHSILKNGNFDALIALSNADPMWFENEENLQIIFKHDKFLPFFSLLSIQRSEKTQKLIESIIRKSDHAPEIQKDLEETIKLFRRKLHASAIGSHSHTNLDCLISKGQKKIYNWISKNFIENIESIVDGFFFSEMIKKSYWYTLHLIISKISWKMANFHSLMSTPCLDSTVFGAFYYDAIKNQNWEPVVKILAIISNNEIKNFLDSSHLDPDKSNFQVVIDQLIKSDNIEIINEIIDFIKKEDQEFYLSMEFCDLPLRVIINQ